MPVRPNFNPDYLYFNHDHCGEAYPYLQARINYSDYYGQPAFPPHKRADEIVRFCGHAESHSLDLQVQQRTSSFRCHA